MAASLDRNGLEQRRKAARRTAWVLGAIALGIFSLFVLSGIVGR